MSLFNSKPNIKLGDFCKSQVDLVFSKQEFDSTFDQLANHYPELNSVGRDVLLKEITAVYLELLSFTWVQWNIQWNRLFMGSTKKLN